MAGLRGPGLRGQLDVRMSITSKRPYLIRAMHEWMLDNNLTPHIVVDARHDGLELPQQHVSDGKLVLNVSMTATRGLTLGNDFLSFEARFAGVSRRLDIPVEAVLGIYARETGQGMIFTEAESNDPGPPDPPDKPAGPQGSRPALKVVK
jgi:stringent starvation protein B